MGTGGGTLIFVGLKDFIATESCSVMNRHIDGMANDAELGADV